MLRISLGRSFPLIVGCSLATWAMLLASCGSPTSQPARSAAGGAPTRTASTPYAPYVNIAIGGTADAPPDLADLYRKTNSDQLMLFGVVADFSSGTGTCAPAWLTKYGLDSTFARSVKQGIASLPHGGEDVILTFGSNSASEYLETVCPDAASTAAQYARAIREYGITSVDFDVEIVTPGAPDPATQATNVRRGQAIALLKTDPQYSDIANIRISVTVPWEPTTIYAQDSAYSNWMQVKSVLNGMGDNGAVPDVTVAMAMNYGSWWESEGMCTGDMFACATKSVESLQAILQDQFPRFRSDYGSLGVEPMIGQNDVYPETFTLANARQLRDYASGKGLARLSMWSVGRDRPCAPSGQPSPTCSGIPDQSEYGFSSAFTGT